VEALVGGRVGHLEGAVVLVDDGVGAERDLSVGPLQVDPDAGLEPLAVLVDEGHEGDRGLEGHRGQAGQAVEDRVGRGVEHGEGPQRDEALDLVGGHLGRPHVVSSQEASGRAAPQPPSLRH